MRIVCMMGRYVRLDIRQCKFWMVKSACLPDGLTLCRWYPYLALDLAWATPEVRVREVLTWNSINFLIVSLGIFKFLLKKLHIWLKNTLFCWKTRPCYSKKPLVLRKKFNTSEKIFETLWKIVPDVKKNAESLKFPLLSPTGRFRALLFWLKMKKGQLTWSSWASAETIVFWWSWNSARQCLHKLQQLKSLEI